MPIESENINNDPNQEISAVKNTLGTFVESRSNNLNLIRMLAAVSVLISHAYPLTLGRDAIQPLFAEFGITLGSMAVYIFFAISGLLITQSFERRPFVVFAVARVLRLFPGLAVALLLTIFILGPMITSLSLGNYFTQTSTYSYFPRNLTLAFLQYDLPGVFALLPYPTAINGSLWTLFHEIVCYLGIVVLGFTGFFATQTRFVVSMVGYAILYFILQNLPETLPGQSRLYELSRLSLPFFMGITFYKFRDHIKLNWIFALLSFITLLLLRKTGYYFEIFAVLATYILFYLAYVPTGFIRHYNNLGDYSYGYYIYAFPVQQAMMFWVHPTDPIVHISLAALPTLFLSMLSWHLVEKPGLALRRPLANKLTRPSPSKI